MIIRDKEIYGGRYYEKYNYCRTGGFAAELTQYIKDNQNKLENFEYKIKDTWRRMHVIPP